MNKRILKLFNEAGFHQPEMERLGIEEKFEKFAELIVRQCGYYADVFESLGCPVDMDPTETKPSDYIKREMGITE